MRLFYEWGCKQLRKYREELCGDSIGVSRHSDYVTLALSDGLGSGVKANILAADTKKRRSRRTDNRVYNVACGRSISINELARTIIDITGSRSKVTYEEERSGDIKHSLADISLIQGDMGFEPDPDLIKGLEKTVRFFLEQSTG